MAVSIADIQKIRKMTGAGLADCKKALTDAEGDFDKAVQIIREKGQAIAAKRSDRETSNGCVLVKADNGFSAMIALKCETDFVAKNQGFVDLTMAILKLASDNKVKTAEEVGKLPMDGLTVADKIVEEVGKTGEKMEIGAYETIEAPTVAFYNHFGNKLAVIVGFNQADVNYEVGHDVAMQIASMNPMAVDRNSVPQETIDTELKVAIEKTKEEQVKKAVEAALKKAGFNLYIAESEDHLEEGIRKGNITEEQAQQIRDLKQATAEQKAANLPEQMIQNIANGRMNKFFKESCLLNQEYIQDSKMSVTDYLKSADKELTVVDFKRFTLRAE